MIKKVLATLGIVTAAGVPAIHAATRHPADAVASSTSTQEADMIICPLTGEEIEPCCCPINGAEKK